MQALNLTKAFQIVKNWLGIVYTKVWAPTRGLLPKVINIAFTKYLCYIDGMVKEKETIENFVRANFLAVSFTRETKTANSF